MGEVRIAHSRIIVIMMVQIAIVYLALITV